MERRLIMKDKSFLKHFSIIGGGTLINMFLSLFTTPLITRLVNPEEYGQLSIFTMYSSIAVMVLCLGLDQALVRYYYEHKGNSEKKALLFKCVKLPIIASIIVSTAVIGMSVSGAYIFEFSSFVMVLLCVYVIIEIVYRFSFLLIRLEYKSKLYSVLNIVKKLSYILVVVPILYLVDGNDLFILIVGTMVSAVVCLIASMFAQANLWNMFTTDEAQCHVQTSELLRYAYPYIISMGITTLFQAIDKISLNMYCTYTEVGIYSSTMTLVHIFAIIQTTFNTLWQPMAVEHFTNFPEDRTYYQKGNQIITVIMFFLGFSLILIKDIFAVLLGARYREAAYILPFLIFNPIMYTISETTVSGLVFMKKSKMQVVVAIGACITNIIGNSLLVPRLGCQGAAISTGLSYVVFFTLRTVLSNKFFYVDFKLVKFYILTFTAILYAGYNTFVKFNIFAVLGYVACIFVLVILYRETIVWSIKYLFSFIRMKKEKRTHVCDSKSESRSFLQ